MATQTVPTLPIAAKPAKKQRNTVTIDPGETKAERFVRLTNRRVPRAIRVIGHVRNLAGKGNYEYTDAQAAKIVASLTDAVTAVRTAFAGAGQQSVSWSL